MFRVALTLVLTLSMLVPPGVCVCRIVPCSHPEPTATSSARPTHSCCHARHPKQRQTASPESVAHEHATPDRHLPGCPTAPEASARNAPLLATAAVLFDMPTCGAFRLVEQPVRATCRYARDTSVPIPAPPLFLSNCSLLI